MCFLGFELSSPLSRHQRLQKLKQYCIPVAFKQASTIGGLAGLEKAFKTTQNALHVPFKGLLGDP